jgi:ankyrin repeat protein
VKALLATGKVDVDSKDEYGRTPLSWAAVNGHEAVVELLESSLCSPFSPRRSISMVAFKGAFSSMGERFGPEPHLP